MVFGHLAKEEIIFDIKGSGQLGVMLFFVLSGFLMAHLYATQVITVSRLVEYSFRRCFRVLPAYVALLLIAYLITPHWVNFPYPMDAINLVKHLKLQGDTSVFWTIPVELKFYLVFPVLWFALGFLNNAIVKTLVMFCLFVFFVNVFPLANADRLDLARYIEFFIGGISVGLIHQHVQLKSAWLKWLINILFIFTVALIIIFIPQNFLKLTGFVHNMWNMPEFLAPLFAGCVLFAANLSGWVNALLSNRIAIFLGNISFSLYLVHLPIIVWVNQSAVLGTTHVLVKVMLSIGLSVLVAYFVYLCVEKPFRNFGALLNGAAQKGVA